MPDAVLIFTFSPIQSFISEARRTADLHVGSAILVRLAKAAAEALQQYGQLIYPAQLGKGVPNKIVARLPWDKVQDAADAANQALDSEWLEIAASAHKELAKWQPRPDALWKSIWDRQIGRQWQTYWAAAALADGAGPNGYAQAYQEASQALDATKRTRAFAQGEEPDLKDSLSGCRQALRTEQLKAQAYWHELSQHVLPGKLRPNGRERLDAIAAVKRFSNLAGQRFLSTSSIASPDFLQAAQERARPALRTYRLKVEALLDDLLFRVRNDADWPYDGDLLYAESLTPERLKDEFGLSQPDASCLDAARKALKELQRAVGAQPATYYAILLLDGDDMGQHVSRCLGQQDAQGAHVRLSRQLSDFSNQVPGLVDGHSGILVYNGGDDVLALVPLSQALELARALAERFRGTVSGATASAGIAVGHHQYPRGAALRAARDAEKQAKQVKDKNAVCVRVLKRSGETTEMRSPWPAMDNKLAELIDLFRSPDGGEQGAALASRFAYEVLGAAYALNQADEMLTAELKRLLKRHRNPRHPSPPDPELWAEQLCQWAAQLPEKAEELGRWMVFARFVAQGGAE